MQLTGSLPTQLRMATPARSTQLTLMTPIMLALIGGIGDGTACFVTHEILPLGPTLNYLARFGPGLVLGLLMLAWLGQYRVLSANARMAVILKVWLGWSLIVPVLSWSVHQGTGLFWATLAGAAVTGCLAFTAALIPYLNEQWQDRVLVFKWLPLSLLVGLTGSWLFLGIMQQHWLADWPSAAQRILANVLLFTPWTAMMMLLAQRYLCQGDSTPESPERLHS